MILNRILSVGLLLSYAIASTACGARTLIRTEGPLAPAASAEGVPYFLAKDLVVVDVTVQKRKKVSWNPLTKPVARQGTSPATLCATQEQEEPDSLVQQVAIVTVADRGSEFRLQTRSPRATKGTTNVTVSEAGLLLGLNATSENVRGEITANIVKGLASIAGTAVGIDARAENVAASTSPGLPSNESCFRVTEVGRTADSAVAKAELRYREFADARLASAIEAKDARDTTTANLLLRKDSLLARGFAASLTGLERAQSARATAFATFVSANKIGVRVTETKKYRFVLNPAELQLNPSEVVLRGSQAARQMLRDGRLVLRLEPPPAHGDKQPSPVVTQRSVSCSVKQPEDCPRVWFRVPRPMILTVYQQRSAEFVEVERGTVSVVLASDAVFHLDLASDRMGSGSTKVVFGRYGNPTSVEQSRTPAMAISSAAFASTLSAARTEFQAGLQSVASAQATIIGIDQAARGARLKALQDQKSLLDAQVALDGATASQELTRLRAQLEAEIALLVAQQSLAAKQATSPSAAAAKAEIEQLRLEIELLKARVELEAAKKALPPPEEL